MKKFISVLAAAALGMCAVPMAASATEGEVITYVDEKGNERSFKGGDVNEDGYIDARDATIVLCYYADISSADAEGRELTDFPFLEGVKKYGDVNEDGWINAMDSTWILNYYSAVSGDIDMPWLSDFVSEYTDELYKMF